MTPKPALQEPAVARTRVLRFDAAQSRPAPRPFFLRWLYPGQR